MVPDADIAEVINGSLIFILPLAAGILLLILYPEIATWLPALAK